MKKLIALLLSLITTLMPVAAGGIIAADLPFNVSAESAVLYCVENGEFIYEKNADSILPMASLTKIMTAVVVIDTLDLDKTVTIDPEACGIEGSSVYLTPGEKLTVKELLYALLLESANDSAAALAIAVAGSIEEFTVLMNEKASEIGLRSSHFTNPHGLDDEQHYSTARDLAMLCKYALENPVFAEIVSTKKAEIPYGDNQAGRLLINHNRLLSSYEGCIGVKTGYTKRCGRCLLSASCRDGVTLIAVTLKAPDDWNDHRSLFNYGFSFLKNYELIGADKYIEAHVINGTQNTVKALIKQCNVVMREEEYNSLKIVYNIKRFYYAPITENDILGTVSWYSGNKLIAEVPVMPIDTIDGIRYKRSIFEKILDLFR